MTHIEEKIYLQSIFDAIDEVYKLKTHQSQKISTYEERLRASFNKLLIPDWYNPDYTSMNGLRKAKSHGQVTRLQRYESKTSDLSTSSSTNSSLTSNDKHRHRSPSRSWSERASLRHNSTTSSNDTNGTYIVPCRRLNDSHENSNYTPGLQRVTQSSTWYRPKKFTVNGKNNTDHSNEPPKPLPRHSKMKHESTNLTDCCSLPSTSNAIVTNHKSNGSIRHPLKPRIMSQAPIPTVEIGDIIMIQETVPSRPVDATTANRRDSTKTCTSDVESFHSIIVPMPDKNLQASDSSSYASFNDQCSSTTSSYHTAVASDDVSSMTDYETPTLKLDNEILSSHSSISDLSNAETLEPNRDDLDIVAISKEEQKPAIIPLVDVGMENLPSSNILSNVSNPSPSLLSSNSSPSAESRPIDGNNWYDEGSIETCIQQTSGQSPSLELREIGNNELLQEVDFNAVGDEFFLFSPRNTTDDEPSSSISDDKHEQDFEQILNSKQTSKQIYSKENQTNDEFSLSDDFLCSSTVDPFGGYKVNPTSIMITNLDDILVGDDDDDYDEGNHLKDRSTYLLNTNFRRPIQEDILYEAEHENSYSDNSQHTASIIIADDNTSIKVDPNIDYLTSVEEPITTETRQSNEIDYSIKQTTEEQKTLPINILPPIYNPMQTSSSLHVDTSNYSTMYRYDSKINQYPEFSLSSSSSAYTPKIRHRHFTVGSYYDNKTTTVALHTNHALYILGSSPVSPLSRATTCETHYHSPISYTNTPLSTLRLMSPYIETNTLLPTYDYQRSPASTRDDQQKQLEQTSTVEKKENIESPVYNTKTESTTSIPTFVVSSPPPPVVPCSIHSHIVTTSETEQQETVSTSPSPPPRFDIPAVRPKTSRGRVPEVPPRVTHTDKPQIENDSSSTENEKKTTLNDDLKFIRGTIKRVLDHHGESSESSLCNEETSEGKNDESASLSHSSKTLSNKSNQYPAVEAVQRFYNTNTKKSSDSEKNQSSTTEKLFSRSNPINVKKKEPIKSNSTDNEQASSEEVDDTLNDIEDDDSQDDKVKRHGKHNSSHTSYENSPSHSSDLRNKATQEPHIFKRFDQTNITTKSASGSQATIQSYETARSSIPPVDIVTQMVIEQSDSFDDGQIAEITGDMVIFYDDIEIVEHSSNMSTTESDSTSSISKSRHTTKTNEPIPPPIPARTLKPAHLIDNNQQQQPIIEPTPSKVNRIYELEKPTPLKKFDVNTVNTMINRNDYFMGPFVTHRHPSARHFVGKLNNDDIASRNSAKPQSSMVKSQTLPIQSGNTMNGYATNNMQVTPKNSFSTLPTRPLSTSTLDPHDKPRSTVADTNALVKQIQNSLSRNSLHETQLSSPLSISTKDLRTFVSSTYSPSDENIMDDDGVVHIQQRNSLYHDEQSFKRQARLSKSFHNVSEYNSTDQYPRKDNNFTPRTTQPSKSVEHNLNQVSQNNTRHSQLLHNFPPIVSSTSFSALPNSEDNARLLSMKWYTGQVSENSEICYNTPHVDNDDLLYNYISAHSSRETQLLLARLQASNDIRIHAALDDIRLRVAQFDGSKSPDDIPIFMRYLESRLRDISNKNLSSASASTTANSSQVNGHRKLSNSTTNGYHTQQQQSDAVSVKSRTSSLGNGLAKETPPLRQLGRQQLRTNGHRASGGEGTTNNNYQPPPPRRASQSSANQENPAVFDDMLNTVLGLPKKGVPTPPPLASYPASSQNREKATPLTQTQISANTTTANKVGNDVGKRLFESGTYKDPRLIYDGPRQNEKEEQPLETSV